MASAVENGLALWMWPLTAAQLAQDWVETMTSAKDVIDARMPIISAALANPFTADYSELTEMVSEKTSAFGQSQRTIHSAQDKVRRAGVANARALGRLSGGGWLGWSEWTQVVERNLEIATTLVTLPTAALAPIHSKARANARRFGRP